MYPFATWRRTDTLSRIPYTRHSPASFSPSCKMLHFPSKSFAPAATPIASNISSNPSSRLCFHSNFIPQTRSYTQISSRRTNRPTPSTMAKFSIWRKSEVEFDFDPPLKSDDLFYALKEAYPYLKTHQSRMREAVISFCTREQKSQDDSCSESSRNASGCSRMSFPEDAFSKPSTDNSSRSSRSPIRRNHQDWRPDEPRRTLKRKLGSLTPETEAASTTLRSSRSTVGSTDRMHSMMDVISFSENGKSQGWAKKPMSDKDRKDYSDTRRLGACKKHRRAKRKVRWLTSQLLKRRL